jgi:predicted PurR-regulated permease PerM
MSLDSREHRNTPIDWMRAILWLLGRLSLYTLAIVGTLYAVGRLRIVIAYVIVAVVLAYVMRPLATWVMRRNILVPRRWKVHAKRGLATLYVLIFLGITGYYSAGFVLRPFVAQIKDVGENWETKYEPQFEKYSADARAWYEKTVSKEWRDKIEQQLTHGSSSGDLTKNVTAWIGSVAGNLSGLAHQIVEIVLLPVLAFYFALDSKKLKHEFVGVLPRRYRREVSRVVHEFNRIMHSYVIGQVILCALAGVVVYFLLLALGVRYALTLGVLAGVTRAIPIVGPILGGIPIIGLTLVTAGLPTAIGVLIAFTILHFVESKFLMPIVIGERVSLHPVVIIIVLLIGQEFGGLLGMFFAAPIAAIIRVMIRRYYLCYHPHKNAPRFLTTSTSLSVEAD